MFQRSLEYARESGYLQGRKIKVVLDTTPILGRGPVKDTYNLLADGIKKLVWALDRSTTAATFNQAGRDTVPMSLVP